MLAKISEWLFVNTDTISELKIVTSETGRWDVALKRKDQINVQILSTFDTEDEALRVFRKINDKLKEVNCLIDLTIQ